MKWHPPVSGIILVTGLTLISGVIHGRMSHRWGPSQDSLAVAKMLEDFPGKFGSWELQSQGKISDVASRQLQCAGYINRVYANHESGAVVSVAVLLGPAGPISVHTPEVCFSSRNHTLTDRRKRVTVPDLEGEEFWALTFQSRSLDATLLRVYYAWSTGGRWSATNEPRVRFAGQPYLYKIQLASVLPPAFDLDERDPCRSFLRDFLPLARSHLVEPPDN